MSKFEKIGDWVDNAVGIFAPKSALKRKIYRAKLSGKRTAQYAAAKKNRLTGNYANVNSNVNAVIGASSASIRASVQQLVRDFPFFQKAVNSVCEYVVGGGVLFQSRVQNASGDLNSTAITKIEDGFNFFADDCEIGGNLHFYEMQDLAKRQELETGEFIFVRHEIKRIKGRERYIPFCLQMIEPDWLTTYNVKNVQKENAIDQGIEYDVKTGEVKAYHFTDPDSWGKTTRMPASRVIHGFKTKRPGQLRGISPFAPSILICQEMQDLLDSEIDAAKLASKWLAIVETTDISARQSGLPLGQQGSGDEDKKIDELENAIIEYLAPNEKITLASNDRPGTNFYPAIQLMLRMVAVSVDLPYELISMDYHGLTYSSARTVRNDFAHALKPTISRLMRQESIPMFYDALDYMVLYDKITLAGYQNNKQRYRMAEWQPPGMEAVDPLRETKSNIDLINAGLKSPQEHAKSRGRDLERIYKEIQQAQELKEKYNIQNSEVSTALANNPEAVGTQKGNLIDLKNKGLLP